MTAVALLDKPFGTLSELITAHAAERPDVEALSWTDGALSWSELDAQIDRAASAFQRDGLKPRDGAAFCAGNSPAYVIALLGALRAGLALCPLPTQVTADALGRMLGDCAAAVLLTGSGAKAGAEAGSGFDGPRVALDDGGAGRAFEDWLAPAGAKPLPVEAAPGDVFNIIYSSGTTGEPKGVVQSYAMRWNMMRIMRDCAPGDVMLLSTPLYSNTTLSCALVPALSRGASVVLVGPFSASRFLEAAQAKRATHAAVVPVQIRRILCSPDFDRYDLSSFRHKMSTSAPLAEDLKRQMVERWPGAFHEVYGLSEGGLTCVLDAGAWPDKLHTVGRPAPGFDVRIIDADGRELPQGETGEVVGASATLMSGYHNQPEKTEESIWRDGAGRRFIRSGDIGYFDEDGFLILVDRKKDVINRGGHKVFPCDIEAVMAGNPFVEEAAVVAAPSVIWGETPVAFVVARPGGALDEKALLTWTNARLGRVQRLAAVRLLAELPRSPIGKVLKRELRALAAAA